MSKAVIILSGGQDSVTVLHSIKDKYDEIHAIHFTYGQKHSIETDVARNLSKGLVTSFTELSLPALGELNSSCSLIKNNDIKMDDKGDKEFPNTFVPGRNLIFINYAAILAYNIGADYIYTGVSEADYSGYPDCRSRFISVAESAINEAFGSNDITICTPLIYLTKKETWAMADDLGVMDLIRYKTVTCYNGIIGDGCGECPSCVLRKAGLDEYISEKYKGEYPGLTK